MPELPEVEIIKRDLNSHVIGHTIMSIFSSHLNLHGKPIPDLSSLHQQHFQSVYRRNKFLILETELNYLVIHLGMTGQLIFTENLPDNKKHIHIVFNLGDCFLYYHDVRRFGMVQLYEKKDYSSYLNLPPFKDLGYEPLSEDFTEKKLKVLIKDNKSNAKKFIMDGTKVCGLGNIYACEVLFLSRIHPEKEINLTTPFQQKLLFRYIKEVLEKSILLGGSSISDYVHLNGSSGKMQEHYFVYGREGKACKICHTTIKKIKQNGRSTFFCPVCQK